MRRITLIACLALTLAAQAQIPAQTPQRAFEVAKKLGTPALYAFLQQMPKGADLHFHITGAVYAESYIRQAAADYLCVTAANFTLTPNIGLTRSIPPQPVCAPDQFPAAKALSDEQTWDAMIDAFSTRDFVPRAGFAAKDQFFSVFDRFLALSPLTNGGQWLDEAATRAAAQNEQYIEVMHLPATGAVLALAGKVHWQGDSPAQLAALRQQTESAGLAAVVAQAKAEFDTITNARNQIEHCNTPQATPACNVKIRWIVGVLRDFTPEQIFVQTLVAFELTKADPDILGVNYLRAENSRGALDQYHLGMEILHWMRPQYPAAHLSLHAGELTLGLVPPEDLRDHIRQAVEIAGAERIGHGVDIGYETGSAQLLKEMATHHILVEINLTSNDLILGVKAPAHPLPLYRAAHVPVALSTDDEGVSRIDLTHEYTRAALEFNLSYADLKNMARASLQHSFLPGESLWETPDVFTAMTHTCTETIPPTPNCAAFLKTSELATEQWELERRFRLFESNLR